MTEVAAVVDATQMAPSDPEVPARAKRRRYTREYKLAILAETDAAQPGTVASILRREGLYSSILAEFRNQRARGSLGDNGVSRGRKSNPFAAENAKLRKQIERLRVELERQRVIIDVQKKLANLLEQQQQTPEEQ